MYCLWTPLSLGWGGGLGRILCKPARMAPYQRGRWVENGGGVYEKFCNLRGGSMKNKRHNKNRYMTTRLGSTKIFWLLEGGLRNILAKSAIVISLYVITHCECLNKTHKSSPVTQLNSKQSAPVCYLEISYFLQSNSVYCNVLLSTVGLAKEGSFRHDSLSLNPWRLR